jgi:hypothetical protein
MMASKPSEFLVKSLLSICAALVFGVPELAVASSGCSAFHGKVDDQTKGEGGNRVGAGFSKGDTLAINIYNAPGMTRGSVNLLQYSSPDGPFQALVKDTFEPFTYTVPASTRDFIYLNLGSVNTGMIVTWCCTPAGSDKRCDAGTISHSPAQ